MDTPKEPLDDIALSDLADRLGTDWLRLARRLGLTAARVDAIQADNPLNTVEQATEMLVAWRRALAPDSGGALATLAEALRKIGRTDLTEALAANHAAGIPSTFHTGPLRVELAQHYINTTCKVPTHPVFPAWVRDIGGIYVDLILTEETNPAGQVPSQPTSPSREEHTMGRGEKMDRKRKVRLGSHEDLVGLDGAGKYRVLLKGRPGSGKSTVIKRITYDWSHLGQRGNESPQSEADGAKSDSTRESNSPSAFSRFTLLFPLKLNQMTCDTSIVDSIYRQILARDTNVSKASLKRFIEARQEEVLFLLDGLDEIPASVFEEDDNFLKDLLTGRILRRCCVIVTSRHHSTHQLLKSYPHYAKVETTGFGSSQRESYVKKYFAGANDQAQLVAEIESSATLRHLAEIPLLLLVMCLVFASKSTLPKRLTELYENATRILLMHLTTKHGAPSGQNQSQLPHQLMKRLGRVALEGLLHSGREKLVFSEDDFSREDIVEGCDIGLLVHDSVPVGLEVESTVTFLHKSFQELCAASYLAELVKTNKKQFKKHLAGVTVDTVGNMEYLLRFCCGTSTRAAKKILRHVKGLQNQSLYFGRSQSQRLRLVLAFEARSKKLGSSLSDVTSFSHLRGEDLQAASYFLENAGLLSTVKDLNVACESSAEMGLLLSMLSRTPHIQEVICHRGTLDTTLEEATVKIPRLRHLTTVYFLDSPAIQASGHSNSLVPQFIAKQANLTHVHLLGVEMHGFVGTLQPHVRTVKSLCLSNSGLLSGDTDLLFDMLTESSNLRVLNLSGNSLHGSTQALVRLASSLEKLDLSNCDIQDEDWASVAEVLSAAASLRLLSLSYNNMHGRLDLLGPVVPHLDMLQLDYCGLEESDIHSLSLLLPDAKNLRKLHLLHNCFYDFEKIKGMISTKTSTSLYLLLSYDVFGWAPDL